MTIKMFVASIRIDGGTQPRQSINEQVVSEYAEALQAGEKLPPVVVFHDGTDHWLADGFHRYHAHRKAKRKDIAADVRNGTRRDAVLFSVGANAAHGLRRTNEDKRRAVQTLLEDAEWSKWSDRQIAEACGVSVPFVGAIRRPEVAQRQQEARAKSSIGDASKAVDKCNPITPEREPEEAAQRRDEAAELKEMLAEQAAQFEETLAENTALQKVVDADDQLAEAAAQIKRLTAENLKLRERITGLTNEVAEAKRLVKFWRGKAEKAERMAA